MGTVVKKCGTGTVLAALSECLTNTEGIFFDPASAAADPEYAMEPTGGSGDGEHPNSGSGRGEGSGGEAGEAAVAAAAADMDGEVVWVTSAAAGVATPSPPEMMSTSSGQTGGRGRGLTLQQQQQQQQQQQPQTVILRAQKVNSDPPDLAFLKGLIDTVATLPPKRHSFVCERLSASLPVCGTVCPQLLSALN